MKKYSPRPIRFLEIHSVDNWKIKIYSISLNHEFVSDNNIENAKKNIAFWLKKAELNELETYKIATLILHEGKEGCFAIINWWIDDNMLQQYIYLSKSQTPTVYTLYSNTGIITCVWELTVIWFERNAWVKHVLAGNNKPDFESYLNEQLNQD
jgi:hypothetical protein